jgi:hypothetical protein
MNPKEQDFLFIRLLLTTMNPKEQDFLFIRLLLFYLIKEFLKI